MLNKHSLYWKALQNKNDFSSADFTEYLADKIWIGCKYLLGGVSFLALIYWLNWFIYLI